MTITAEPDLSNLSGEAQAFIAQATRDAEKAFRVFRETGTVAANGTANFVERVPGEEIAVVLNDPGPWEDDQAVHPVVAGFDGGGFIQEFAALFRARPEISTILHIHSPWLGGWAQTHRSLPIRYAASQRLTLSRSIPQHIDRSKSAATFVLEQLETDPHLAAIFEANGGVNVIGRKGVLDTAKFTVLLEEGAQFQAIAEGLGGSVEFDPTNLAAQWGRTGLLDEARRLGLVPAH
jgi:L-ribulose-5-phosphate 4-epimerase